MQERSSTGSRGQLNKATLQVLEVLTACGKRSEPFGVTEVARELGISKNMAFRALATLLEFELLVRSKCGRKYELGYGVLWFKGGDYDHHFDIRSICAPYLERMHLLTGESIFLSVIVGRNHVTIDGVEAHGVRVRHTTPGLLVPLHASPASRVLLAHLSDEELEEYIKVATPLKRFTATTITDPEKLREEVRVVRKQGFAWGYGDHYDHATYIAFPVLDGVGRPHAAITLGAPKERVGRSELQKMLPGLLEIIAELNLESQMYLAESRINFGQH